MAQGSTSDGNHWHAVILLVVFIALIVGIALVDPHIVNRGPSIRPVLDEECLNDPPDMPEAMSPPTIDPSSAAFSVDFDDAEVGEYSERDLARDWNDPEWNNGVDEGRVTVVETPDLGRALRVEYPDGKFGAGSSGAQWPLPFEPTEAAYLRYRVKFVGDFEFVRGGKLPGFAGGEANTGGEPPDGTDGWSARMMWRESGCAAFYVYHPDQPTEFGEDFDWQTAFAPDRWYLVEQVIVMNTPGENDGVALGWLDGELEAERRDIRFRDVDTFAIDQLYFSTFFGGGSDSWAPDKDEYIEFDDFVVAPISPEAVDRVGQS